MLTVLIAAAVVVGVPVVAALAFVVGMRSRAPVVINMVRRLARAMKRLPLKSAGRGDAYASVVVHTGRASGCRYRTPVRAVAVDGRVVVALPYGSGSDWVRNVLAAGGAAMLHRDRMYVLDRPRLVPLAEVESYFTAKDRRAHRLFGVSEALLAHATPAESGAADVGSAHAHPATP